MSAKVPRTSIVHLIIGVAVGILAAVGVFNSMIGFPLVCAGILGALGLISLCRDRPRTAFAIRVLMLVLTAGVPVVGWYVQTRDVAQRQAARQAEIFDTLGGAAAPSLVGLEPLNVDAVRLDEVTSFSGKVTIVSFWAVWCSPCWTELPELDALYREHRADGLNVIAIIAYDDPDDEAERLTDRAAAIQFLRGRDLTLPAAIGAGDAHRAYHARSLPSTALIDETGTIVAYGVGLDGGRDVMRQAAEMIRSE